METHDNLVLWIDSQHAQWAKRFCQITGWSDADRQLWSKYATDPLPPWPGPRVSARWEHPITDDNPRSTRVVGFIDILVRVETPRVCHLRASDTQPDAVEIVYTPVAIVAFEAKPRLDDLGALMRQINTYRLYVNRETTFAVVSPDTRYRELLARQGVLFFAPESPQESLAL